MKAHNIQSAGTLLVGPTYGLHFFCGIKVVCILQEAPIAMPPNDSDSSDDESGSFTTTNVLLGYASKEPTDDEFSQLGGYPV